MNVAILGATSHLSKNLALMICGSTDIKLSLFARNPKNVVDFLGKQSISVGDLAVQPIESFPGKDQEYDTVINCVGYGTPEKVLASGSQIQRTTEIYDNIALDAVSSRKCKSYICFSSGAVFGRYLTAPVSDESLFSIAMNNILAEDSYRISKLNSEVKHRAFADYSIVDLRIFNFFSRYIDLSSKFLICDIVRSILMRDVFLTNRTDIVRDFLHPHDLFIAVMACINARINDAFDLYSREPIAKFKLLEACKERYGMRVEFSDDITYKSPTGEKSCYYSTSRRAEKSIGYNPQYSSLQCVFQEIDALLEISHLR